MQRVSITLDQIQVCHYWRPIMKAKKMLHNRFRSNDIKMKSMNARRTLPGGRCVVKLSIQFTTNVKEVIVH